MTTHGQPTTGHGQPTGRDTTGPLSIPEAADRLGITASAARKRAQRLATGRDVTGIVRAVKDDASGEWRVWISEASEAPDPALDADVVAELRARVATLEDALDDARAERDRWRDALEREQEASRESRILLGQATRRMLEDTEAEPGRRRSWWRRILGD